MKLSVTLVGVMVAVTAITIGPRYTAPGYTIVTNVISKLTFQMAREVGADQGISADTL